MDVFMTRDEALNTLEIERGYVTKDVIKKNYQRLAFKHHPDRNIGNPDAEAIMQRINVARDLLYRMPDDVRPIPHSSVINLAGITIVKRDGKTLVSGKTFHSKEVLKSRGFKWSPENMVWWREGNYPIEEYLGY